MSNIVPLLDLSGTISDLTQKKMSCTSRFESRAQGIWATARQRTVDRKQRLGNKQDVCNTKKQ
jgi:hypothetical protein